ncbi:MAG: choice-of-anchor J domain-containing protein [Muribaculaceae bacterium]|nr:choice-of-anchor J domain-containing protein [Muribaculaceae bacterium]
MINHYRLFNLAASALITATAFCAAPGNRVFYGFSLGSAEFADGTKDYDYGFVSYPFDPTESEAEIFGKILDSYYDTPSTGVFAAAGVDGLIYACEYTVSGTMSSPIPGDLVVYNTFNGLKETIGSWERPGTNFKPQDMSWSEKDRKMYAVGFEGGQSGLYELDLKTAEFSKICTIMNGGGTIAVHPNGTIYSLSTSGTLYTLDPESGKAVKVMDTKLSGMMNNQSMEFDRATGLLYWVSSTNSHPQGYENSWLEEINVNEGTIREIGSVGITARFTGLHIPSAENLLAPAAPTDIKSVAAGDGSLSATISFTAPDFTLNGSKDLGTLYGYVINRNGEKIMASTGTVAPGEKLEYTDPSVPETGNYRYDIYFYNGKGNGAKGTVFQYIGPDAPGKPTAIKTDVADDMRSLVLSWDAPEVGRHLGAYNPENTTYTVIRNDNLVVAKDIKECTVTDTEFVRVMKYNYVITASNEQGSSDATSGNVILGPGFEIPFEQTFENDAQVQNLWTSVDANNDGFSWMFNTTLGQMAFGDYEAAAEYIVSPPLGNSENGSADEWLISPPLKFEADMEYEVAISSRSFSTDQIEFYIGKKNTVEAMTEKIGELSITHDPENPDIEPTTGTVAFRIRGVEIPVFDKDETRCIGIRLVTKHPTHGYIQINGIYVDEKGTYTNGITEVETSDNNVTISLQGRTLAIFGSFRLAEVYDLNGRKMKSTDSAVMDLTDLTDGVYVVKIDGKGFKLAL